MSKEILEETHKNMDLVLENLKLLKQNDPTNTRLNKALFNLRETLSHLVIYESKGE